MFYTITVDIEPYISYEEYFVNIKEFLSPNFLKNLEWKNASVLINNEEKVDTEKRKTLQLNKNVFIKKFGDALSGDSFMEFLKFNNLSISKEGWKFLKYEEGDFFLKHNDKIGLYTALLFPFCQENLNCQGGELVFENGIFESQKIKFHTLVIFPVNAFHEVKKISSGKRYVFKTSLICENPFPPILNFDKKHEMEDELCDGGLFNNSGGDY